LGPGRLGLLVQALEVVVAATGETGAEGDGRQHGGGAAKGTVEHGEAPPRMGGGRRTRWKLTPAGPARVRAALRAQSGDGGVRRNAHRTDVSATDGDRHGIRFATPGSAAARRPVYPGHGRPRPGRPGDR